MIVRTFQPNDAPSVAALDASYTTTQAWRVEQKEGQEELTVAFRAVRLPRPLKVTPERGRPWLSEAWATPELILVAEERDRIWGCLALQVEQPRELGWIRDLVVDTSVRRRGVGAALVAEAQRWGQARRLSTLLAAVRTRNYPATQFYQRSGFVFCGFSDRYLPNRDIALFYACPLT